MRLVRLMGGIAAVALGAAFVLSGRGIEDWTAAVTGPRGWVAGIVIGLAAAWLLGVDWRSIPWRMRAFLSVHRRDFAWSALAAISLTYLVVG
ncbi:MAG: hypothetical protein RL291_526 [Pseudomonadota bacterium]